MHAIDMRSPVTARHGALKLALGAMALLASLTAAAQSASAPNASAHDDTAHCIAVMRDHADELAGRIKAGDASHEPALRSELLRAAALVGRVYFSGMRDGAAAKARLNEAHEQQRSWDAQRKARLRATCLRRADAELAGASPIERFIFERVAQGRYKRMMR